VHDSLTVPLLLLCCGGGNVAADGKRRHKDSHANVRVFHFCFFTDCKGNILHLL